MRYALIIAGGSGTRLWPMSTQQLPKQLIPFINGRSLLQIAMDRLEGLTPDDRIFVCAGESTREVMLDRLPRLAPERFIAEPVGRDTLNAVALGTGVIGRDDPDAVVAVFTADHIIEPVDSFQKVVEQGYEAAERDDPTLVTFGVTPTHAATGYGYLQLGGPLAGSPASIVERFQEKPDRETARAYLDAGPRQYLWNSGMFVWKTSTLMDCVERYTPENHQALRQVIAAWDTPERDAELASVYPGLKKISVDYAVMEPASQDPSVAVAAVPMPLTWLDVGSWPSFAQTCTKDAAGNATSGCKHVMMDTRNTLIASDDPEHLITTIGCEDLVIIHTAHSTLVCRADQAEHIKKLHAEVAQRHGAAHL